MAAQFPDRGDFRADIDRTTLQYRYMMRLSLYFDLLGQRV
jgi:hypothetical protein